MEVGARVWIHNVEEIWEAGVIDEIKQDESICIRLENGEYSIVTSNNVYLRNENDDFTNIPNLISLQYLHEPELLHAVCNRYESNLIYTYVGEILLSFNPFQRLNIYTMKEIEKYTINIDQYDLPPHVYAIAANAYKSLCDEKKNQSILVSGESGAGKTENTKFLMQYLTEVGALDADTAAAMAAAAPKAKRNTRSKANGTPASTAQIQTKILQTNPILEAFGNARTVRNDNSSRFGKFIELQFGSHHKIVGAKLSVYLLEKIRVSHQSADERNFHIFYELCAGADDELATQLELSDAEDFDLLNESGCYTRRDGVDDSEQFQLTSQAFTDMGIPDDEQHSIYGIVAALLHLGNVSFCSQTCQASNLDQASIEESTLRHFHIAAKLLGVSSEELTKALITRQVATTKDKITINLTPFQATEAKQSLTQSLYGGLFKWIVNRLSMIIRHDSASVNTVGILDIFGFENLQTNGFEQLCINYANERLQSQFNELVFAKEQRMYEAEGIEWKYIEYPDNAPCLQLLEDRPHGMWCLLDEEGMLPKGSNEGWISKLYSVYLEDDTMDMRRRQSEPPPKMKAPTPLTQAPAVKPIRPFFATSSQRVEFQFIIGHFAGRVMYENDAFLQKNQDALPAEAIDLCGSSSNAIVQALLQAAPITGNSKSALAKRGSGRQLVRQPSNLRASSVSAQFKVQLDDLIQVIGRTQARYIRCIKSNEKGLPRHLNKPRVVQQLRSGGVLEAVRIARAGYAVRVDHLSFMEAFGFFRPKKLGTKKDTKGLCEQTVAAVMVQFLAHEPHTVDIAQQVLKGNKFDRHAFQEACGLAGFQIGNSKIFFRKDVYNEMRRFRQQTLARHVTAIQRHFRGYGARVLTSKMKKAVYSIQVWMRACLAYRAKRRAAATVIQTKIRGWISRRHYLKLLAANLKLQVWIRDRTWKRKLNKRVQARTPPKPPASTEEVKTGERRRVQPVNVVATAVLVAEPVAEPVVPITPPPTPPAFVPPAIQVNKSPPPSSKAVPIIEPPIRRPEVDSLMVSLSVENAQLKQKLEELRKNPPPTTLDASLTFAHQQIRSLSTQLTQLQMQCALLELDQSKDASPTDVNLNLPAPNSLEEAQNQLQILLQRVSSARRQLECLEDRKKRELTTKQEEAQVMALMETIQPVVTTVRHVVSYVPVVSYVVSKVESKAHISPHTWYLLLQTSQSVVKSVTDMATSMLVSRPRSSSNSEASSEVVAKLKEKMEALMDLNIEQAIQIKQLKEKLNESMMMQQNIQMRALEEKLVHQMKQIKTHEDEKMKRMEDELAYTTACVNQLANAIVRGPLKEKQVVVHDSFDIQDPVMYHARR